MKKLAIKLIPSIILVNCLFSCSSFKICLDQSGIREIAGYIMNNYKTGTKEELKDYMADLNFLSETNTYNPESIKIQPLKKWNLTRKDITQQRLEFPSCLKFDDVKTDTAVFYFYRKAELSNQNIILWIPGFGVSDFAFQFIRKFFNEELDSGYSILFYNIPYHLERIQPGKKAGEGFFTADTERNLETVRISLCEIRTALSYLNSEGITNISGWGGSVGAALLWLTSIHIKFDHMALMIPIVDWNTIVFNPGLKTVLNRNEKEGLSDGLIRSAYNYISPINYPSLTPEGRIQVLYAEYDQLSPERNVLEFAGKWGITNIHGYDESHGSILIDDRMYNDYSEFLKEMQK